MAEHPRKNLTIDYYWQTIQCIFVFALWRKLNVALFSAVFEQFSQQLIFMRSHYVLCGSNICFKVRKICRIFVNLHENLYSVRVKMHMDFIEYFLHLLISSYVWIIWFYLVQIFSLSALIRNKQQDMQPIKVKGLIHPKMKIDIFLLPTCRSNSIKTLFVFGTQFKIF